MLVTIYETLANDILCIVGLYPRENDDISQQVPCWDMRNVRRWSWCCLVENWELSLTGL